MLVVGFNLYCQLLKQAVTQIKGEKPRLRLDVDLQLDFVVTNEGEFVPATKTRSGGIQSAEGLGKAPLLERIPAFIPVAYVSDPALRIRAYRSVAEVTSHEQLDRLRRDWRDRFGEFFPAADDLLDIIEIKIAAQAYGVIRQI